MNKRTLCIWIISELSYPFEAVFSGVVQSVVRSFWLFVFINLASSSFLVHNENNDTDDDWIRLKKLRKTPMGMQIPKTMPTTLSLEVDDPTDPSSTTNCDSATDIPAISPLLITSLRAWSWSAASADPGSADGAALPSKSTEPSLIELHVIAFVLPLTAAAKTLKNLKKFKLKVLMTIMSLILKVNLNFLAHFHPKNL